MEKSIRAMKRVVPGGERTVPLSLRQPLGGNGRKDEKEILKKSQRSRRRREKLPSRRGLQGH